MPQCNQCYKTFRSEAALHAHCRDRDDHPYCDECSRLFVHGMALNQHLASSPLHRDDNSESDEDDNYYYDSDSDQYGQEEAYCQSCQRLFVDTESLNKHLEYSSVHNWCFICSRDFSSPTALSQHNNSPVHKPAVHQCPFCGKAHKVPSGTALHIESGCHQVNRHQVTQAVRALNISPSITTSRRLIGAPTITTYQANEQSWNGRGYECYFCHRTFQSLNSLNTHLNSPAHDPDEFKCPRCKHEYKLVSGLIQHIESGVCGMARIEQVEDFASDLTAQFSRLLRF